MAQEAHYGRPLRVLALDGGGVRGLSCLMMLRNVMNQIAQDEKIAEPENMRPADYFDLICGTSTGGLIAILLGRLRLTVEQAIRIYQALAKTIFDKERGVSMFGVRLSKNGEERYDAEVLKKAIQDVVLKYTGDKNTRMFEPANNDGTRDCYTFLLAVFERVVNNEEPHLFTTYQQEDRTTIWEAARATSAATGFFEAMKVGNPAATYIDAGLGYNNPSEQACDEAINLWGVRPIGLFLSMGTGNETEASMPTHPSLFGVGKQVKQVQALAKLTTSANRVHNAVFKRLKREKDTLYIRFNVERGLDKVGLDEWNKEGELASCTTAYFDNAETREKKKTCANRLRQLSGTAKPFTVLADNFVATHEDDVNNPGPKQPNMRFWYREEVGASGYPDSVTVNTKFEDPHVRPPGKYILSLRSVSNLQLRGQAFGVPPGRYKVTWLCWFWAGKNFPVSGGYCTPRAPFTENSVVERRFPAKNPNQQLPEHEPVYFSFPCNLRFSVGRAKVPGHAFKHNCPVDIDRFPVVAAELLQPGFQDYVLIPGLWNTYQNRGWCELGETVVDVTNPDGHLAFVIALWEVYNRGDERAVNIFGGFSFAGVRLYPLPY